MADYNNDGVDWTEQDERNLWEQEMSHLKSGPREPVPEYMTRSVIRAERPNNAKHVRFAAIELMSTMLINANSYFPPPRQWTKILPQWFLSRSPRRRTAAGELAWKRWWGSLSATERDAKTWAEIVEAPWPIESWTNRFRSATDEEERPGPWYWWGSEIIDDNTLDVAVVSFDWPFAMHALYWLLRASGATTAMEFE